MTLGFRVVTTVKKHDIIPSVAVYVQLALLLLIDFSCDQVIVRNQLRDKKFIGSWVATKFFIVGKAW